MDPRLLKDKENIRALEVAWNHHDEGITNLRWHFAFAYARMRAKCKEIQALKKPLNTSKSMLQEELQALTLELEHVESEDIILKWEA